MSARRNAFDNDLLADLGITNTQTGAVPSNDSRASNESTPEAPTGPSSAAQPAKTKRIGVDVSEQVWIATKILAAQQGTTVAQLIRSHLDQLIRDQT